MLCYVGLWVGYVVNWPFFAAADEAVLRAFHNVGSAFPGWVAFWHGVSAVLGPNALRLLVVVIITTAILRRQVRQAAFLALSVMGMGLVTAGAKALGGRPRPATAFDVENSTSFPSGHALGIMVAVLALTAVLLPTLSARARTPVIAVGAVLVVLGGVARVALNVHHPSDVLAGWVLGYLWFLLCLVLVRPVPLPTEADQGITR